MLKGVYYFQDPFVEFDRLLREENQIEIVAHVLNEILSEGSDYDLVVFFRVLDPDESSHQVKY